MGKKFKWLIPEEIKFRRYYRVYPLALDYLRKVKVCSRYELRKKFSVDTVRKLVGNPKVGFINLTGRTGSLKHKTTELFNANQPFNQTLFIFYWKGEEDALVDYLVKLIKKPVDEKKMRAITKRFSS